MKVWFHNNIWLMLKGKWDRIFYYDVAWKRPFCLLRGHNLTTLAGTTQAREGYPVYICARCHKYFTEAQAKDEKIK